MSSVQLKRGTASQWFTKNPILKNGELGIELDTKRIKLGNGTTQWRSLSYITVIPADLENTVGSYLEVVEKGNPGGLATLNSEGYIPDSQIPASIARDTEIITSYNDLDDLPSLFSGSYNDLTNKPSLFSGSYTNLTDKPTLFSGSYEDLSNKPTGLATETYVGTAISNLLDSAPETLNTLNEIAAAINDDSSYAATVTEVLGTKASLTGLETLSNKTIFRPTITAAGNTTTQTLSTLIISKFLGATASIVVENTSPIASAVAGDTIVFSDIASLSPYTYVVGSTYNFEGGTSISFSNTQYQSGAQSPMFSWASDGETNFTTTTEFSSQENVTVSSAEIGYLNNVNSPIQTQINNINDGLSSKSDKIISISSKSTSYAIASTDLGKLIEMSDGGTISIEDSSSFPEGFTIDILQTGTSQVTVAGIGTTVINATPGLKLRTRWSSATLIKRSLDLWVLLGDLAA